MRAWSPAVLLLLPVTLYADGIDDFVKAEMQRQRIPGCAVAVIRNGKATKMKGYGLANVELNVPVTPTTVFMLASVSKQFVASAVMLLVQEGKLSLDDALDKHFPGGPEVWKSITIRHLLSHTGGLQRELPDWTAFKSFTEAELLDMAKRAKSNFAPGERYEYCNVGYFLSGLLISKASGMPWQEFVKKRIFEPAGMTATRATSMFDIVPNRASSYEFEGDVMQNPGPLVGVRTSGAFLSTITDMAKWESALLAGNPVGQATLDRMWMPTPLNGGKTSQYGFGWRVEPFRGRRLVQHDGSLLGFRTSYLRFVDDKVSIVVLCNAGQANASLIARGVAMRAERGLSFQSWKPNGRLTEDMRKQVMQSLKDLAEGRSPTDATPALAQSLATMSPASRKTIAEQLASMKNLLLLREDMVAGQGMEKLGVDVRQVFYIRLESNDKPMFYTFYMTPDSKIALIETARD